jgi:hypothetical protein
VPASAVLAVFYSLQFRVLNVGGLAVVTEYQSIYCQFISHFFPKERRVRAGLRQRISVRRRVLGYCVAFLEYSLESLFAHRDFLGVIEIGKHERKSFVLRYIRPGTTFNFPS